MSETLERPVDTSAAGTTVTDWLTSFEKALTSGNVDAGVELFGDDSYWRDLIAFTWNIVTVEGPEGVRDMLGQTLDRVRPTRFAVADDLGEPSESGGVIESWIRFRDLSRPRPWSPAAQRRQGLDAADDPERAQGSRGADD